HILSDFDETLTVDATLHAPAFVAAYSSKWIAVYKLNEADAAAFRVRTQAETAEVWELHLESSAHRSEVNDFGPKGPWRVRPADAHARAVAPLEVRTVRRPRDVVAEMYPYASLFSKGWVVRFPRLLPDGSPLVGPDPPSLIVRITGPAGS